jgi:hypothetical protein
MPEKTLPQNEKNWGCGPEKQMGGNDHQELYPKFEERSFDLLRDPDRITQNARSG